MSSLTFTMLMEPMGFPDAAGNNGPLVLPGIIVTVNPVRKDLFTDC